MPLFQSSEQHCSLSLLQLLTSRFHHDHSRFIVTVAVDHRSFWAWIPSTTKQKAYYSTPEPIGLKFHNIYLGESSRFGLRKAFCIIDRKIYSVPLKIIQISYMFEHLSEDYYSAVPEQHPVHQDVGVGALCKQNRWELK